MGGGLMQLVAYGAQDIYLTGNPQITFFKVVYRRHTNFSMETIQQTINGSQTIGTSSSSGTVTISRNGDLVSKVYVTSKDTSAVTDGSKIVSEVEIEIGGQKIDRHYAEWNDVWNELSTPDSKAIGLKSMQCAVGTRDNTGVSLIQVPLNFWFCRNPGLALPLIALQYHEVKLKFTWGLSTEVGATVTPTVEVWCDYIYLDTDERRRFAQVSHEYLIEQLQKGTASGETTNKLNFNHPVKELIWVTPATNAYTTARLVLNGHDRFADQEEEYFQLRQPFDYHTSVPAQNLPTGAVKLNRFTQVAQAIVVAAGSTLLNHNEQLTTNQPFQLFPSIATGDAAVVAAGTTGKFITLFAPLASATTSAASGGALNANGSIVLLQVGDKVLVNMNNTVAAAKVSKSTFATVTAVYSDVATTLNAKTPGTSIVSTGAAFAATALGTLHAQSIMYEFDVPIHDGGATSNGVATGDSVCIYLLQDNQARTSKMVKKINVYSFGLKPEEHQPSGTCNFSRIDNAQLITGVTLSTTDNIYAVNYNVLRIMSGMGGLAYSN